MTRLTYRTLIHNQKGLSLLEVVAALLILSIALLIMSHFLIRSFEQSSGQDEQQIAMNLARQTAEQWKQDTDAYRQLQKELASSTSSHDITLADVTINERTYRQTVTIQRFATANTGTENNPMILLTVTIHSDANQELARLSTAVANPEIARIGGGS
ncbi:prepilin-type N-terminal cleavage/methylation domain-containing protein [Brevibacillus dissolubilis]|uniref:prepilin-type N-terminal cleavage/methylation domain-containing protein n=1 Tax=Brevibacillus dissolubilis TaxID=1844116 RepID=UPI00111779F4|nr:prepilin-type N-terminal cleavage/methylation domain-containing protein [Brevibacillus dissolubilis]